MAAVKQRTHYFTMDTRISHELENNPKSPSVFPLETFLPAVHTWFKEHFGVPTPPQSQGWPAIQRGDNTLILSPTGSGKTLAAFLWGIDQIYRSLIAVQSVSIKNKQSPAGVRLLYISPLKALNNDVNRNLRVPLQGITKTAQVMEIDLPEIRVAVRSGDTPQRERQGMTGVKL